MDIDLSILRMLEREKEISFDILVEAIEQALLTAYHKTPGAQSEARVELDRKTGHVTVYAAEVVRPAAGEADHPWTEGDNVNQAVGQGALQTDPLQMAVAYAAIANGGDVVRPHVGMEVQDSNGSVVQEIDPGSQRHVDIDPQYRAAILEGLHLAAQAPGGTSYPVFGNFPIPMAGKTGTAERPPQGDQSWYMCVAPYPNPKIVVAATIEEGGFGVESAAPVAEHVLAAYYNEHPDEAKAAGGKAPSLGPIQTGAPTVSNPY